jgi:hypothetical protein
MRGLLRLLREHADAVEADLSRFHQIDYRDRWRFDEHGRRLTLRMIAVRVRHLPADSATAMALGGSGWTVGDFLAADQFRALAGQAHPADPRSGSHRVSDEERAAWRKRKAARARRAARQRQN